MEILSLIFKWAFSSENKAFFIGSMAGGWLYVMHIFTIYSAPELIIKSAMGLVAAFATGFMTLLGKTFFELKIKPKLFKNNGNGKPNTDQKRA